MILKCLSITNYRNLPLSVLDFSPNVNCFVGANGMGKSNVLDAIYYLSFCRGFATAQDALNINHQSDFFILEADYETESNSQHHVCCALKRGARKRLKIDGKDVKRISEHVGKIPLVMIAPADSALITGGSEERRHFMDMVIMQYNAVYLDSLIRYERALKQRNTLLKQEAEPDEAVMDVIEAMMSETGEVIYNERKRFVEEFQPIFLDLYRRLAGNVTEEVAMSYVSHGERGDLQSQLRDWRQRERIVGYSLHGVHKDDLDLTLNGFAVKREASQGQQKTYFIAMKLAQYVFLKNKGEKMMNYKTQGVCSRAIHFDVVDNKVTNVAFEGGCSGNTQGVAALVEGMDIDEAIRRMEGIRCGFKSTSCPDQLATALKQYKAQN